VTDHDDDQWLDGLAGRGDAASPARREALALRQALRASEPSTEKMIRLWPRDAHREQRLLERALREGLIDRVPRRAPRWALPLAAGVVLVFGAAITWQSQRPAPVDILRGEESVVRLEAADPAELKQRILTALRAAGVEATGYEALGVHGIDADLPRPITSDTRRVLQQFSLPEPADGVLRVEIRQAP
jgi:hypothetical protein